jgi:7,8-dihydropterin-6-yl-methyl-4-(beta-D-ribofuranosyl)aminobenzene 5'-phosphate synthase
VNTLTYIQEKMGSKKIFAIIGGTHLDSGDEIQLRETLQYLKDHSFEKLGASHCTGLRGIYFFKNMLKDKFFVAHTGVALEI